MHNLTGVVGVAAGGVHSLANLSTSTMTGRITFVGRTNYWDCARISLKDTSTGTVTNYEVLTDNAGNYSVSGVPASSSHVLCYSPTYLRRMVTPVIVPLGGTVTVDFLNLKPGDLNDSNAVTWLDIAPFSAGYGSTGDSLP